MPTEQVTAERAVVAEELKPAEEEAMPDPAESDWVIQRPKRAIITAEESLKRMKAFPERREQFIASVRKGKG